MKKIVFFSLLLFTAATCFSQKNVLLPVGTVVMIKADSAISVNDVQEGNTITLKVAENVYTSEGDIAIPEGSTALARVVGIVKSKITRAKRRLTICTKEVVLPDGQKITLDNTTYTFSGKITLIDKLTPVRNMQNPAIKVKKTKGEIPDNVLIEATLNVSQYITILN